MEKGILEQLEQMRALMIQSGMKHGFGNAKTIQLSKRLDELLNEYDMLNRSKIEDEIEETNFFQ
ncbi:aspartyl-phosphate phosphatase Spo0E family protein [Lysinibacillus sp. LZ02]|uniref:aspartyl-phosphate phosphatase Spo0E family protein n=1 Tax=Lysinibacillus sp. LZ02 TaxID=3420668 RepID=UPI003D3634C2